MLDMGGVVVPLFAEVAFERFRALGVEPTEWLNPYLQKGCFFELENGDITTDEFCRELERLTGRAHISHEEAAQCWLGFLRQPSNEQLQYLLELKSRYHLCLLSNTNPYIAAHLRSARFSAVGLPITHYFHSLFISCEMHLSKPGREIYLKALATDNMRAEETVFIDDGPANVQTASELGIHTIHVTTNEPWRDLLEERLRKLS